ncbi:hypothetical protein BC834DRAFT_33543 [Gloeopeniophorella convolvens]|nr:hypothetical protein BC834DRAFT_33543 [Gloeopeniophorella convolvens]
MLPKSEHVPGSALLSGGSQYDHRRRKSASDSITPRSRPPQLAVQPGLLITESGSSMILQGVLYLEPLSLTLVSKVIYHEFMTSIKLKFFRASRCSTTIMQELAITIYYSPGITSPRAHVLGALPALAAGSPSSISVARAQFSSKGRPTTPHVGSASFIQRITCSTRVLESCPTNFES